MRKIAPFVRAADKFEDEVIDEVALLPSVWCREPLVKRQLWLKIIEDGDESWDVDMIEQLRGAGMTLGIVSNVFKIYHAEQQIKRKHKDPQPTTPSRNNREIQRLLRDKGKMIYHVFNPRVSHMTPEQRFQHAITVRNRTFGPKDAICVSPYLDVEVTEDNKRFLSLSPDDINVHRLLQVRLMIV